MNSTVFRAATALLWAIPGLTVAQDEDPVFSGPQAGETAPSFSVAGVIGPMANETFMPLDHADGKSVLLLFASDQHKSRPGIAMLRGLVAYANSVREEGLSTYLVWLTDDPTDTKTWLGRASRALPQEIPVTYSPDGGEGPGSYGLNRDVAITALVVADGKVLHNFALIQPSPAADTPRIAAAVAESLDVDPPSSDQLAELSSMRRPADDNPRAMNEQVTRMMRQLQSLNDEAIIERVINAVDRLAQQPATAAMVRTQAQGAKERDGFDELPEMAREALNRWSEMRQRPAAGDSGVDTDRVRSLLQPLLNKNATPEEVAAIAARIEEALADDDAMRAEIGTICRRVAGSDVFERYGTPAAREVLSKWAEAFAPDDDSR